MFKIGSIRDADSAEVVVKNPHTSLPLFTVTLAGPEHPKRKAIVFAKQRRMRQALQRTGKIEFSDPVDEEQENIDMLVACTLDWSKDIVDGDDNKPLSCTAENVRKFYTAEGHGWIRSFLMKALDENDRFIKSSEQT